METVKRFFRSFTPLDGIVWGSSVLAILLSFFLSRNTDYLQLATSLVGACCLILSAKGNVLGQFLSVLFAVFYGIVSYFFRYYGEMITYLGMTAPMAVASIVSWLRHPFRGQKSEVTVGHLKRWELPALLAASGAVSVPFYFILKALGNNNLLFSTLSVFTSLLAVLLTVRRSPYYAFAYALNDIVLIVLWSLAIRENTEYIAMVVCFSVFLVNDVYSLINWLRRRKRQAELLRLEQAEAKASE